MRSPANRPFTSMIVAVVALLVALAAKAPAQVEWKAGEWIGTSSDAFPVQSSDTAFRYSFPGFKSMATFNILRISGERPIQLDFQGAEDGGHVYRGPNGTVKVQRDGADGLRASYSALEQPSIALFEVRFDDDATTITAPLGGKSVQIISPEATYEVFVRSDRVFRSATHRGYRIIAPIDPGQTAQLTMKRVELPPTPAPTPEPTEAPAETPADAPAETAAATPAPAAP